MRRETEAERQVRLRRRNARRSERHNGGSPKSKISPRLTSALG